MPDDDGGAPGSAGVGEFKHIKPAGVVFPDDITSKNSVGVESTVWGSIKSRIRLQPATFIQGPVHAADITIHSEAVTNHGVGTAPLEQQWDENMSSWLLAANIPENVNIKFDTPAKLDQYAAGTIPGVTDSATIPNSRNICNAITCSGRVDEYYVRQIVAGVKDASWVYDVSGFLLKFIMAAKIQRDYAAMGLPLNVGRVPVLANSFWGFANIGHYSEQDIAGNWPLHAAPFVPLNRNKASEATFRHWNTCSIPLDRTEFTDNEFQAINMMVAEGECAGPRGAAAISVCQLFNFDRVSIFWWNNGTWQNPDHDAVANVAAPPALGSAWWLALAQKLADHLKARDSLVRAYTRFALLTTGSVLNTTVPPVGGGAAVATDFWVNAAYEIHHSMPVPRGSNFLFKFAGADKNTRVYPLFSNDDKALCSLMGQGDKLWHAVLAVGLAIGTGFSSTLAYLNIGGRELGNTACMNPAFRVASRNFDMVCRNLFKAGRSLMAQIYEMTAYMASLPLYGNFNSLCFLTPGGWNCGMQGTRPDAAAVIDWNAWFGENIPFRWHPLLIRILYVGYNAVWGIFAPGTVWKNGVALWARDHNGQLRLDAVLDKSWAAYSNSAARYILKIDCPLILNALSQSGFWPAIPGGIPVGWKLFAPAAGDGSYPQGDLAPALLPFAGVAGGGLQTFAPGVARTFDWPTAQLRAPYIMANAYGPANTTRMRNEGDLNMPYCGVANKVT